MKHNQLVIFSRVLILLISISLIILLSFKFVDIINQSSNAKPPIKKVGTNFSHAEELSFVMYKNWVQSLAQMTILLFGAIWGFIISQKMVFSTKKNYSLWIAFCVPNICFLFVHILYTKALGRFIEMLYQLEIITMEKGTDYFYILPQAQARFFLYGILSSVIFILLVLYLKKKDMVDLYKN